MAGDWITSHLEMKQRLKNHTTLIIITAVCLGASVVIGPDAEAADRLSIVSAYLCLVLLGAALLIGPYHAFRQGRPLANTCIRRDIGIWGALSGLIHFYLANLLSMNYEYLGIYVEAAPVPPSPEIRSELYSWGTISGYVIAVLFIVLLALSNDWAMRKIGLKWWKRIQRVSYVGFLLTCVHAFLFQILESREALWVVVVIIITLAVFFWQVRGIFFIMKAGASKLQT
jgi:sulfoxide reductase heme-binding subunit YedZ